MPIHVSQGFHPHSAQFEIPFLDNFLSTDARVCKLAVLKPSNKRTTMLPHPAGTRRIITRSGIMEERNGVVMECLKRIYPLDDMVVSGPDFNLTNCVPKLAKI